MLYALLAAPLLAALLTVFASGKDSESSFRIGFALSLAIAVCGSALVLSLIHI